MLTSVHLSNEKIIVLSGNRFFNKILISRYSIIPIGDECIINGVITNESIVIDGLTNLRIHKRIPKKIRLVIDSSTILIKNLQLPNLPPKMMTEQVKSSFEPVRSSYDNLLYDYTVYNFANKGESGHSVLASAVESSFIEAYINLFGEAKIEIESIDIGASCLIKAMGFCDSLKKATYILSVLDGNYMLSVLFVNGTYYYQRRTRLIAQRAMSKSYEEIADEISAILQFNKAQQTGSEVTACYFSGLWDNELSLLNSVSTLTGISANLLPRGKRIVLTNKVSVSGFDPRDYLIAIGNLVNK